MVDKCEWRFDGRGTILCGCGASGKSDPHMWLILAKSCNDTSLCRTCDRPIKLIAQPQGDAKP